MHQVCFSTLCREYTDTKTRFTTQTCTMSNGSLLRRRLVHTVHPARSSTGMTNLLIFACNWCRCLAGLYCMFVRRCLGSFCTIQARTKCAAKTPPGTHVTAATTTTTKNKMNPGMKMWTLRQCNIYTNLILFSVLTVSKNDLCHHRYVFKLIIKCSGRAIQLII